MKPYLVGSALLHVAVVWALFIFVPPSNLRANPTAIQVALVNLPRGAVTPASPSAAPAPEPAPAKPAPEEVKPPEEHAVRLPEKKPPPARPTPPARSRSGSQASGSTLESAPMGVPGLSGTASVDAADFEFTYYLI